MNVYICACSFAWINVNVSLFMWVCVCIHRNVFGNVMNGNIPAHVRLCMYPCTYVRVCVKKRTK